MNTLAHTGMGRVRIHSDGRQEHYPPLADAFHQVQIPVSKWWSEVVMVTGGHRIARRDIVLGAANKDGGAHVDNKLEPEYETISSPGAFGILIHIRDGKRMTLSIENTHLVTLRQIGHELLHSPALLVLEADD